MVLGDRGQAPVGSGGRSWSGAPLPTLLAICSLGDIQSCFLFILNIIAELGLSFTIFEGENFKLVRVGE